MKEIILGGVYVAKPTRLAKAATAHRSNQLADLARDCGPSGSSVPNLPRPKQTEAFAVPGDPPSSTSADSWRSAVAHRSDAVAPGSPAGGRCASGRLNTVWKERIQDTQHRLNQSPWGTSETQSSQNDWNLREPQSALLINPASSAAIVILSVFSCALSSLRRFNSAALGLPSFEKGSTQSCSSIAWSVLKLAARLHSCVKETSWNCAAHLVAPCATTTAK